MSANWEAKTIEVIWLVVHEVVKDGLFNLFFSRRTETADHDILSIADICDKKKQKPDSINIDNGLFCINWLYIGIIVSTFERNPYLLSLNMHNWNL